MNNKQMKGVDIVNTNTSNSQPLGNIQLVVLTTLIVLITVQLIIFVLWDKNNNDNNISNNSFVSANSLSHVYDIMTGIVMSMIVIGIITIGQSLSSSSSSSSSADFKNTDITVSTEATTVATVTPGAQDDDHSSSTSRNHIIKQTLQNVDDDDDDNKLAVCSADRIITNRADLVDNTIIEARDDISDSITTTTTTTTLEVPFIAVNSPKIVDVNDNEANEDHYILPITFHNREPLYTHDLYSSSTTTATTTTTDTSSNIINTNSTVNASSTQPQTLFPTTNATNTNTPSSSPSSSSASVTAPILSASAPVQMKSTPKKPPTILSTLDAMNAEAAAAAEAANNAAAIAAAKAQPLYIKILHKLSNLVRLDSELLAHEILLDPEYQLPKIVIKTTEPIEEESNIYDDVDDHERMQQAMMYKFKSTLYRSFRDKLVTSLRKSPIDTFDQVQVGMIILIKYQSSQPIMTRMAPPAPVNTNSNNTVVNGEEPSKTARSIILSAKILAIYPAEHDHNDDSDGVVATSSSTTASSVSRNQYADVEYVCDGMKENKILISERVILSSSPSDPSILLSLLDEIYSQIVALIPNRIDLHQTILKTIQSSFLYDVIKCQKCNPQNDLLPILIYIQNILKELHSLHKVKIIDDWINELTLSFQYHNNNMNEIAIILPDFFEKANNIIAEIRLDMANYYISILATSLRTNNNGYEYLKKNFQYRCQVGITFLDATASLIFDQFLPVSSNFRATINDLIDAGVIIDTVTNNNNNNSSNSSDVNNSRLNIELSDILLSTNTGRSTVNTTNNNNNGPSLSKCIIARTFISLLQLQVRLNTLEGFYFLPETFRFDGDRLSYLRDIIDRICIIASIMIVTRQVLVKYQVPPSCIDIKSELDLHERLDILLTLRDASLSSLAIEIVRHVENCLLKKQRLQGVSSTSFQNNNSQQSSSSSPLSSSLSNPSTSPTPSSLLLPSIDKQELNDYVLKSIKDIIGINNPVLKLFTKRVYKLILRAILEQDYLNLLPSYSLQSPAHQKNLEELIGTCVFLFNHNYLIHGDLYHDIIARACTIGLNENNNNNNNNNNA